MQTCTVRRRRNRRVVPLVSLAATWTPATCAATGNATPTTPMAHAATTTPSSAIEQVATEPAAWLPRLSAGW